MATTNGPVEEFDVLVIGGGFAGIYQLDRLRDLGHTVKVFEAGRSWAESGTGTAIPVLA